MNTNKTEAMWLGYIFFYCSDEYDCIKWKLRLNILGIYFSNSIPASEIDDNWLPHIENIQRTIVTWSKRNYSITGIFFYCKVLSPTANNLRYAGTCSASGYD